MNKINIISCFLLFLFFLSCSVRAEQMPEHLLSWAHENPVINIGVDATFPPFDYVNEQGLPDGIGELVRQQLSEVLPIELQATSITSFSNEYKLLRQGTTDAISICGITEDRQGQVLFSDSFLQMTPIIVVNKQSAILNEADIKEHHKIAAISGYASAEYLTNIKASSRSVESNMEGYKKVNSGEVDGFITYLYMYKYMQNKYELNSIKPVASSQFPRLDLGFCINEDKPELVEIINWGLAQLGKDFLLGAQAQWLEPTKAEKDQQTQVIQQQAIGLDKLLIYSVVFAVVLIFLVMFFAKSFASNIATRFDTTRFRMTYFIVLVSIVLLLFAIINIYLANFREQIVQDQQETFNLTRGVTEKALRGWYIERKQVTTDIANNRRLRQQVEGLIAAYARDDNVAITAFKRTLHEFFSDRPFTTNSGRSYTISNLDGRYLLNFVEYAEGLTSTVKLRRPELFAKVIAGQTQFIPPVWANVDIDGNTSAGDKDSELFISAPIKDLSGKVIAVLGLRFNPDAEYSSLFIDGRLGKTFESYAIGPEGYLLSESRFVKELQQQGRVPVGESSILHIQLPNPEINPIVQAAKFKIDGQNLEGYTDYRGEQVVGQWLWFEDFNFTVVSEINYDEMFAEYYSLHNVLYIGLIIASALIFSLSIFMITIANRANEISRRSQQELAAQVASRTKELSDSEIKNKLINSSVADGIIGLDKQGKLIFVNDSACALMAMTEEEVLAQSIISIFGETDKNITRFEDTLIAKSIKTKEVIRIGHEELKVTSGRVFPAEYSISPVDHDETELAAVIAFQDITARLQETERIEKMLENLPACMVIMNQQDKVEQINQTGVELLGWQKEDIIGQPVDLFIPNEQVESHKALLAKFFAEEIVIDTNTLERDFRVKHKSGKLIDIQAVYTPVQFYDGVYAVVMVRDITVEKQAEQALLEAKRISDDASKAKSDFLANMSHEIRTPMNAILGMSHLALGCEIEPKAHNYISKAHRAAESLLGIINDILDFSKIEAGKLDLEKIDFNLHEVFDGLANIIGIKTYEKDLELLFDIAPDVPLMLVGDPMRLNQVLINIAGNAVKLPNRDRLLYQLRWLVRIVTMLKYNFV